MKINREELLSCLTNIKPGLATKEIIDQSTSFVFKNGKVYTFNNEIAVSHPISKQLTGAVKANELYTLLTRYNEEELKIETTDKEFSVKGKNSEAGIALTTEITIPIDEIGVPTKWKPLPENFIEAVDFCHFSASRDLIQPEFTYLHIKDNHIEACDRLRFTIYKLSHDIDSKPPILLPANCAKILVDYNPIEYAVTDNWIHFMSSEKTVFSCRTGTGEYPDLSIFTNTKGKKIEFPDNFKQSLGTAEVFASSALRGRELVKIRVLKYKTIVESMNEVGWFKEIIKTNYDGIESSFETDPAFMIKMLPVAESITLAQNVKIKDLEGGGILEFKGKDFKHCFTTAIPKVKEGKKKGKKKGTHK